LTVVLLVGAVAAAVTVVAIPNDVAANLRAGICRIGGGQDCRPGGGGASDGASPQSPGASPGAPSGASPGTSPGNSPGSPGGSPGSPGGSPGLPGGSPGAETPEQRELREALEALSRAERDAQAVEDEWDGFDLLEEIARLGLDFIAGDIIACIENPNLGDCLWALIGLVPWGKIGKLLGSIPKIIKLIDRFLDLKRRLDKARKARTDARDRVERARDACRRRGPNSFPPGTPVLMADGTRQPIQHLRVGDLVWASDPATGAAGPHPVTALITGTGRKHLVELTIDPDAQLGGPTATVTATAEHPFWVGPARQWIDAAALAPGDRLHTANGRPALIVATAHRTRHQRVHNLTIAGTHTYHITAADRDILVHNQPGPTPGEQCGPDAPRPTTTRLEGPGPHVIKDEHGNTITDIDRLDNGTLVEEKSITDVDLTNQSIEGWVQDNVYTKFYKYLKARDYIDGYQNAPIGFRFTGRGMNPALRREIEETVDYLRQINPGVDIRLEFAD
jgi:hypothetical protein